jgi:hypothetical protein
VKWYEQYGRNPSWIVKWYRKYGRNASWNVKRHGKYGRFLLVIITHKETSSPFSCLTPPPPPPPPSSSSSSVADATLHLLLLCRRRHFRSGSLTVTSLPVTLLLSRDFRLLPIAPQKCGFVSSSLLLTCFSNHFYLHFLLHAIHVAYTFY